MIEFITDHYLIFAFISLLVLLALSFCTFVALLALEQLFKLSSRGWCAQLVMLLLAIIAFPGTFTGECVVMLWDKQQGPIRFGWEFATGLLGSAWSNIFPEDGSAFVHEYE